MFAVQSGGVSVKSSAISRTALAAVIGVAGLMMAPSVFAQSPLANLPPAQSTSDRSTSDTSTSNQKPGDLTSATPNTPTWPARPDGIDVYKLPAAPTETPFGLPKDLLPPPNVQTAAETTPAPPPNAQPAAPVAVVAAPEHVAAPAAAAPATAVIVIPPPPTGLFSNLPKDLTPPAAIVSPAPAAPTATASTVAPPPPVATPAVPPAASPAAAPVPEFKILAELKDEIARDRKGVVPKSDRDDVQKFYEARDGAALWVDASGLNKNAAALRAEFAKSADYALDATAFKIDAPKDTSSKELAAAEYDMTAAALRYARHAGGGRVDPTRLSKAIDRKAQILPSADVLKALAASKDFAATLRGFHPKHAQFEQLRQQLLRLRAGEQIVEAPPAPEPQKGKNAAKTPKAMSRDELERKLVTNMEMWRWMPALGDYHIQANIPEYQFRIVKNGKVIHTERVIVGKTANMTPMFSDELRLVVFKPFWNVPDSIKFKELQPQLMRSGSALSKAGLRAQINGRDVDPGEFDWGLADMRQIHIFQPPGPGNALGQVKFLFPNKHDVYMHDTPTKPLFSNSTRAYSHGCVRVRDPLKFAEVILANDKGWSRTQINQLANSGPDNNEIKLKDKVPVHLTYFTAWVDDGGKLQTVSDVYGHEERVQLGIEGKVDQIPQPKEEVFRAPVADDRARMAARIDARRRRQAEQQDPVGTIFKSLFNF